MSNFPALRIEPARMRFSIGALLVCLFLLCNYLIVQSQSGAADLKGQTRQVIVAPSQTVDAGGVTLKRDSDHDGISDEDELRIGNDPNNPADADADGDGDGLSNADEVAAGTNPSVADSDGDGVSDNEEVRLGYNPVDPASTPPSGAAVVSLRITPGALSLSVNFLVGPRSAQLAVTGVLNTGATIDLTTTTGTSYQSLNTGVALVDASGRVVGVGAGATSIIVRNGELTAQTPVVVSVFSPQQVGSVYIPGYANGVEASGGYAYVAAGAAGLHVVAVSDRRLPRIIASLDTPGNANDVKVVGNRAYVADGARGLEILDIADPQNPALLGSFDTPGDAWDVAVSGTTAYVADGSAGLEIINISDPQNPVLLGSVDTPGTAKAVDVSGSLAIVADGSGGLRVIDVSNPAIPSIAGSISTVDARDIKVDGNLAYIADSSGSLKVIDFTAPSAPILRGSTPTSQVSSMLGVAKAGSFAFGVNNPSANVARIPIVDVSNPVGPTLRFNLNISTQYRGTGIAVDDQFVYLTADRSGQENGASGDSHLYIAQYVVTGDSGGLAPVTTIVSPQNGDVALEGSRIDLIATALDDVYVTGVRFSVNGDAVATVTAAPYQFQYTVPSGVTTLIVEATAFDAAGNSAAAVPVAVNVLGEFPHRVIINNPAEGGQLISGQVVELFATSTNPRGPGVAYALNGLPLRVSRNDPARQSFMVPLGASGLTITGTSTDFLGETVTANRTVQVVPDPMTSARGRIIDAAGNPVAGANVSLKLNGLKAEFFRFDAPLSDFPDLGTQPPDATKLVAAVDFRNPNNLFNTDTFAVGLAPYYAARFTGLFRSPNGGRYEFTLGTRGRARLTINGTSFDVADTGSFTEVTNIIQLPDGGSYPVVVEYFHNAGDAELQLSYSPPSTSFGEDFIIHSWNWDLNAFTAVTDSNGRFSISNIPTVLGDLRFACAATVGGQEMKGGLSRRALRGGMTEAGDITVRVPARVGYYDLDRDRGFVEQARAIEAAGMQAFSLTNLNAASFDGLDILFVNNNDVFNPGYSSIYTANLQRVFDFVSAGGVLIFHDMRVANAQTVLPGSPSLIVRDLLTFNQYFDKRNINVLDNTTAVTNGPGGVVTDTTLDSPTSQSVSGGYVVGGSIPPGGKGILSRANPSQLLLISYPYGRGWIVYSTTPLGFYMYGSASSDYMKVTFQSVYAPNVLNYANELR